MTNKPAGVIFSDLDGTFLDDRYHPALNAAALARVTARWRVVWVSSRTAEELMHLQRMMGHTDDVIGENGGVCLCRSEQTARALGAPTPLGGAWLARVGAPKAEVRRLVDDAFSVERLSVRTFDDLTPEELATRSHYAPADAERARTRRASVLLVDIDPADPRTARALDALRTAGCTVVHGGRWISVVRGANKGSTARAWLAREVPSDAASSPKVVAIGNADNDESLLAFAGEAFVVRAPDGSYPPRLAALPHARPLQRTGTDGWAEMLDLLEQSVEGVS